MDIVVTTFNLNTKFRYWNKVKTFLLKKKKEI